MNIYLHPDKQPREKWSSGIDLVVSYMHDLLPTVGIEPVSRASKHDLSAAHICPPNREVVDVLHCHGLYPTGGEKPMQGWTWELNQRAIQAIRSAYLTTVPSPWVAEMFARDMGFLPEVVPHGIDLAEWPERTDRGVTKSTVLWNKNRSVDVCDPTPMQELAQLMAGSASVQFISTFGEARSNVAITGAIPHTRMKELIYRCGVYLSTTKETFGIGILEALAAGLPVLTWYSGNAPFLVEHKKSGFIAPNGDLEGLRYGLEYILDNWEILSRNARERARTFSWEAAIKQYAEVYRRAQMRAKAAHEGLVSIVIPCYNYGKYVAHAIQSVQAQTGCAFECIVVDDGSQDDSATVIKNAIETDNRFKVVTQPNRGVAAARNRGAAEAHGDFIMFLDADDALMPESVSTLLRGIQADRTLGLVYGGLTAIDKMGVPMEGPGEWPGVFRVEGQLGGKNQVPSCCLLRTEAFRRTGGFRQHTAPAEDAELWTRIALEGYQIKQVTTRPVYFYRLHVDSASSKSRDFGKPEVDWRAWLPSVQGGHIPFASIQAPKELSLPVVDYDEPLLSIVIPCGPGHQGVLQEALDSVAGQIDHRYEVVVVDDTVEGNLSDFGTLPYKEVFPWVRWVRNEKRGNVSAARNRGVIASRGKYLAFLDADDFLYRDFVGAMLTTIMNCAEDSTLVYSDWVSYPERKTHKAENWNVARLLDHALFAITFVHPRRAFDIIGGFDESLDLWEDWDYTIRLALEGYHAIRLIKPLFAYRYDTGRRREASLQDQDRLLSIVRQKYAEAPQKKRRS